MRKSKVGAAKVAVKLFCQSTGKFVCEINVSPTVWSALQKAAKDGECSLDDAFNAAVFKGIQLLRRLAA